MSSRAVRALYRLCLKKAQELQQCGLQLEFRRAIDKQAWMLGKSSMKMTQPSPAYNLDAFRSQLPWAAGALQVQEESRGVFTPSEVRELIRQQFRHPTQPVTEAEYIDRAITTLRVLSDQVYLAQCSSVCETEGVVVEVTAAYIGKEGELDPLYEPDEDLPEKSMYTYRVRVSNTGDKAVQVLARHWVVEDSKGKRVEVPKWSPAVVGTRPILEPHDCFEYYSRTELDTREGRMLGAFQVGELGATAKPVRLFEADVAPFKLVPPPGA